MTEPQTDMLNVLRDFKETFGPFELKFTGPNYVAVTPGYPAQEPKLECSSQPWDYKAKHKLHDKIMAWRAKK